MIGVKRKKNEPTWTAWGNLATGKALVTSEDQTVPLLEDSDDWTRIYIGDRYGATIAYEVWPGAWIAGRQKGAQ